MEDGAYRFGEFSMKPSERGLCRGANNIPLQPKAFDALQLLMRNHGGLVSRDEIVRTLWPGVHVTEANLTNIIVQLRKALGREAIQTVSKFGYRFTLPVTGEPGVKQAAYASFVRGKELLRERSLESISSARDMFWLSLATDPQFAPAWAWLGRTCRLMEKFKGEPPTKPNLAEAAFQRALLIDPDLACAHQFYTQLQVDSGQARQAMMRLAARVRRRGEAPETLAALVQVLRYCGLLDESLVAHERAVALDPTVKTSVAHTYFLLGDYAKVFETYNSGTPYYLDAAAWAGLKNVDHAATLLRSRLTQPDLGPFMSGIMASLLAVLEGKVEEAAEAIERTEVFLEPEAVFYLARHCGMLNALAPAVQLVRRARTEGFWSSRTLENDVAFAALRGEPEFDVELQEARHLEAESRSMFHQELGCAFKR